MTAKAVTENMDTAKSRPIRMVFSRCQVFG
jgi:hypothetical protein